VREAEVGDRWLLCSDGLSGFVSDETLERTLAEVESPDTCAEQLIQLALRAGGQDNITCIVADVVDASSAPGTTPQVVGAAAANRKRTSVAEGSPAAKAAALDRASDHPDDEDDDTHDERARSRTLGATVAGVGLLAVLIAAALFGYRWSQQQFFVGAEAQDVAIYRGLSQDVGPVKLSHPYEKQDIPLDTLPAVWRDRVNSGIPADDLGHARQIVNTLLQRSTLCEAVEPTAAPTQAPTAAPTPTTAPTAGAAPTATPTVPPSGSATAAPTPGPTAQQPFPTPVPTNSRGQVLPAGCSG
jgi:protein phosphatase